MQETAKNLIPDFSDDAAYQSNPEECSKAETKRVSRLVTELLWLFERGVGPQGTVASFPVLCQEFKLRPRKDWASFIQQHYDANNINTLYWTESRKVLNPPDGFYDNVDDALDREYRPEIIHIDLAPERHEIISLVTADVCWKWKRMWRPLSGLTLRNLTKQRWFTGKDGWDIKRVDLDTIDHDAALRWKPLVYLINRGTKYDLTMSVTCR